MGIKRDRTIQLRLTDEEYEALHLKAYQVAMPPEMLLELFAMDLVAGGSSKSLAEKWLSQFAAPKGGLDLFHQYLAKKEQFISFAKQCLEQDEAETRQRKLAGQLREERDPAKREKLKEEIDAIIGESDKRLIEMEEVYSDYREENPNTKFSFEDAIQSAKNTYAKMQMALSGKSFEFSDGSKLVDIRRILPQEEPDKITLDFQNEQIIWETPEKEGTDNSLPVSEMKPLVYAILGQGEFDLTHLADFLNILVCSPELVDQFYAAANLYGQDDEEPIDKSAVLADITVTVAKKTAQALKDASEEMGRTMGEVVDRLVMQLAPEEQEAAEFIALEEMTMCLSGLGAKDKMESVRGICASLLATMTAEEQEATIDRANEMRREMVEKLSKLDGKTLKKLGDALKKLFRKKGAE